MASCFGGQRSQNMGRSLEDSKLIQGISHGKKHLSFGNEWIGHSIGKISDGRHEES